MTPLPIPEPSAFTILGGDGVDTIGATTLSGTSIVGGSEAIRSPLTQLHQPLPSSSDLVAVLTPLASPT